MSALEMLHHGFSFIPTSYYEPDHWNTKPPLLIWFQYLSIKVFGINELAVRMPSLISALLVFPVLFFFLRKNGLSKHYAWITTLIFFSFPVVLGIHTFKTGDYDALLTLNMLIYSLAYFTFLRNTKTEYLWICFLFLFLSVFTKGIAGLFFVPGLFIFTLLNKKLTEILKKRVFWLGMGCFLLLSTSYYFLRNYYDPGYFAAVLENEILGRFHTIKEQHSGTWYYYLENLLLKDISVYAMLICPAIVNTIWQKKKNDLSVFALVLFGSHMLLLSIAQTKLYWYALPSYPFIAIIMAIFLIDICEKAPLVKENIYIAFAATLFIPLLFQFKKVTSVHELPIDDGIFHTSYFLREENLFAEFKNQNIKIISSGYHEHIRFYAIKLNSTGYNLHFHTLDNLAPGDLVIYEKRLLSESGLEGRHQPVSCDQHVCLIRME